MDHNGSRRGDEIFKSCEFLGIKKGANKNLSVQEYRSRLFSYMFDSYMESHQVSGFSNTPIIINGDGYRQFMHLIARSKHQSIVDVIKDDVLEGWGK